MTDALDTVEKLRQATKLTDNKEVIKTRVASLVFKGAAVSPFLFSVMLVLIRFIRCLKIRLIIRMLHGVITNLFGHFRHLSFYSSSVSAKILQFYSALAAPYW
ncbi:MAG: hypothetical protein ACUVT5_05890 [Candidatus Bathyarchaeales archaeon]